MKNPKQPSHSILKLIPISFLFCVIGMMLWKAYNKMGFMESALIFLGGLTLVALLLWIARDMRVEEGARERLADVDTEADKNQQYSRSVDREIKRITR